MQPCTPAIERYTHLATGQERQLVERAGLRRTCVGGREDADRRGHMAIGRARGDLLQNILQLAHPRHRDEADQDVDLISRGQLATNLLQQ